MDDPDESLGNQGNPPVLQQLVSASPFERKKANGIPHSPLSSAGCLSEGLVHESEIDVDVSETGLSQAQDSSTDKSVAIRIYKMEAVKCAVMVSAFVVALAHLYIYHPVFGTQFCKEQDVPEEELEFFHHGWTSMLVIFLMEFCSVILKVWCTWSTPVLAVATAYKFEGNIGVLFGEYIVVGATYVIMGYNLMPVFLETRTGRRVYGVRYMEWLVDACGLVYLDCHILFGQRVENFYMAFVWSVAYVLFGLWSAIADSWILYWAMLAASWLTFGIVCFMLIRFLQQDPRPFKPFRKGTKPAILCFIITWWILYGVLFMVAFADAIPQWAEQFLWTGMDVVMKFSHTVVLMAWRASLWEIDAVVKQKRLKHDALLHSLRKPRQSRTEIVLSFWQD
jgi:hypothetical protein